MEDIRSQLSQFTGTECYYRTLYKGLIFTDGIKAMAELCGAFWLIDAIASHQPEALRNPRLKEMQVWRLEARDNQGVLYCCEDTPKLKDAKIRQDIEYTDFPLDSINLWVCQNSETDWVLMLVSEY